MKKDSSKMAKLIVALIATFAIGAVVMAQSTVDLPFYEDWESGGYTQTSNRQVNGWYFCKDGVDDESIVRRGNLHAFLTTGATQGSATVIATPWINQVADTFSFYIYGSSLSGQTAHVEYGFIPNDATINSPSDICSLFVPIDTVDLSVSNQWQRTTVAMQPYYDIYGEMHRFAIRLTGSTNQQIYLDEIRACQAVEEPEGPCPRATTQGRDFWVMFLYAQNTTHPEQNATQDRRIYVTSDEAATVTISNNITGNDQFNLTAPNYAASRSVGPNVLNIATVFDGGYHVTSTADIWVTARNYIPNTHDDALIYPTSALGTHYIVQDYPDPGQYGGEVGILATEDSTIITMTVPCAIQNTSIAAGTTLNITLNKGQTYFLLAAANQNFSGMVVTSNDKPFALFQGDFGNTVPITGNGRDHIYEQAMPINQWGQEFIVVGMPTQSSNNQIRITSSEDGCSIYWNGTFATTLSAAGTWETTLTPNTEATITATKPIQVIQYMGSYRTSGNIGDPASATIFPNDRGICKVAFYADNSPDIPDQNHYVNIVCHNDYNNGLRLDGQPLPNNHLFHTVGNYKCHRVPVPYTNSNHGLHRIENEDGPFLAYAYGYGSWEAYAFPLGCAINARENLEDTTMYFDTICQGTSYEGYGFNLQATQTQTAGQYTYWRQESEPNTIHHIGLQLNIIATSYDTIRRSIIDGDSLIFADTTIYHNGTYRFFHTSANGCDSIVVLIVSYEGLDLTADRKSICPGEEAVLTSFGIRTPRWDSSPADSSLAALSGHTSITVRPTTTTTYYLVGADNQILKSITIEVTPPPTLCIDQHPAIVDFDRPLVNLADCSAGRATTRWEFSDGKYMTGSKITYNVHRPLPDSIAVHMTSCNANNCCADTTWWIPCRIRSVWFPNTFTPNLETNNRFGCITTYNIVEFSLTIFDRRGLEIWHTEDIDQPWDGTAKGRPMPQGAYVYRWSFTADDNTRLNGIGTVTLLR